MDNISNKDFVHLHCHSCFSTLDSIADLKKFVLKARQMGFPAIALTDHGNIGGTIKLIQECYATKDKKNNDIPYEPIVPILGEEFYCARNRLNKDKETQPDGRRGNRHLVLLAKNFEGYQNLCELSHKSWVEGFYSSPRIDFELLSKYSKGLICQSACASSIVNANLIYDRYDKAKEAATILKDIFGDDFYLEIMYHGLDFQSKIIPDILKLGKELDITCIATNDVHYIEKSQASSHEIFLCMSTKKCLSDDSRMRFPYQELYLKSAEEMMEVFSSIPHILYNTKNIYEKIDIGDIKRNLFGGMKLPKFDIPKDCVNQFDYLEKMAYKGLKENGWDNSKKHIDALKKELNDVKVAFDNNGYDFATYFLIVQDIIKWAKDRGIGVGDGRGSCVASILLRCIGVTGGIDPLQESLGLLWERFLGFSDIHFVSEKDFGFEQEINLLDIEKDSESVDSADSGLEEHIDI